MDSGLTPWQDAQVAVLGACLIDPKAAVKVLGQTAAQDFDGVFRPVWLAVSEAFHAGEPVDPVVISARLGGDGESRALMLRLMERTPSAAHVDAYLAVLREQSQLEAVRRLGQELTGAVTLDDARKTLDRLTGRMAQRPETPFYSWQELAERYLERLQSGKAPEYLSWGLRELDSVLCARPGSFVILGGNPSDGKTALAIQFALHQSRNRRVGFFSLETDPDVVFERGLAHQSALALGRIHAGAQGKEEMELVLDQLKASGRQNLFVRQSSGLSVREIQAMSVAHSLDVIYIDYLQLLCPEQTRESRQEQVAQISRALHTMAQTTGITVVGLSQLSRPERQGEGRTVKGDYLPRETPEPTMRGLRESGQLEQDADAVLLLWRPYPGDRRQTDRKLKVAKNKEGESGVKLLLSFDGATQTFRTKDPRSLSQRIREAGKAGQAARPGSWAAEANGLRQLTLNQPLRETELTGDDPENPWR